MYDSNDDYDFAPTSSSKLASLFGTSMYNKDDEINNSNPSLMYTAPKQPKATSIPEKSGTLKSQSSVILAKVISLWKIEDNGKIHLGKHGIAIIGNLEQTVFECIIYKERNNILIRLHLNKNFRWYTYPDNFAAFYDMDTIFWMIKFNNANDDSVFLSELIKYKCQIIKKESLKSDQIALESSDILKNEEDSTDSSKKPNLLSEAKTIKLQSDNSLRTEDESSNTTTKANILSRITKMGQQILPQNVLKQTSTDLSDSELEETKQKKPMLAPRKFKRTQNIPEKDNSPLGTVMSHHNLLPAATVHENIRNQMVLVPSSQYPSVPILYGDTDVNRYLLQQNAEMKNHLLQITSKLDGLLVEKTSNVGTESNSNSRTKVLELKIENLEVELNDCQSNYVKLKKDYEECNEKFKNVSSAGTDLQKYKQEIHAKLVALGVETLDEFEDLLLENTKLKKQIEELNSTENNLKLKLIDFEEYYKANKDKEKTLTLSKSKELELTTDVIKKQMNLLYQLVMENFDEGDKVYSNKVIQQVMVKNIKEITYNIMDELRKDIYNIVLTD